MKQPKKHVFAGISLALLALVFFQACNTKTENVNEESDTTQEQTQFASEDISYKKMTDKPFDELVAAVEAAATSRKFRVLHKHDISATLAEKGMELPPYTIIEVCNGSYAHKVLTSNKEVGMMLPCRIAVYEENGKNNVLLMKPSLISMFVPGDYGTIPEDVEKTLIEVVDEAVL